MAKVDDNREEPDEKKQGSIPTASTPSSRMGPGTQIDHFRVDHELGRGGAGVVYLAEDTRLGRKVAIKVLPPEIVGNPQVLRRWKREARLLASLNHPNIATIHEELEEAEGTSYLVLEYVEGETLRERIARSALTAEETVSIAVQIAEAMSAAHDKGVIHRDLKPANIKMTPECRVKVLDFGIAKIFGDQKHEQLGTIVTQPGQVIGTPGYMSPEQSLGKDIDQRTDIWSFGCMLYEMLTGKRPFPGTDTSEVLEAMLRSEPEWEVMPEAIESPLREIIHKCLEKDSDKRYQSAGDLLQDLMDYRNTLVAQTSVPFDIRALLRYASQPKIIIPTILTIVAICSASTWIINRNAKIRWARVEAMPEIDRLYEQKQYVAAFNLACRVQKYLPEDPLFLELWSKVSIKKSIVTEPPGADVSYKEYFFPDGDWEYIGSSPLEGIRCPRGRLRWKITKEGFVDREVAVPSRRPLNIKLWQEDPATSDMILWTARKSIIFLGGLVPSKPIKVPEFFIDKYEVTNEDFKVFQDQGGYDKQEYWKHKFVRNGLEVPWEEAIGTFKDQTGRTGPSTWAGGTYPAGQGQYPVSGVSWYEACAYAEFVDKELPTVSHWSTAACTGEVSYIFPYSNFGGKGPAQVGSHKGMGQSGLYDAAGNVKEWCWNATNDSGQTRYILGGDWTERNYMFFCIDTKSVWDRSFSNGFRCVKYTGDKDRIPDSFFQPPKQSITDYTSFKPVSDEIFEIYLDQYSYDQSDLNAVVEVVDTDYTHYCRRERIALDAAYGGERVIVNLFLPKGVEPPFQAVIFFPGSSAIQKESFEKNLIKGYHKSIIQSGRAFVWPMYKGTFERQTNRIDAVPDDTVAYRDWIIQTAKDLGRSIDYLETRNDMDCQKLAYLGDSWGSMVGPIMLAQEDRFKLGILICGGTWGIRTLPEVYDFNFAPRVKQPVLMINGVLDRLFPLELSQKPFFDSFGSVPEDKKHVLLPGGHSIEYTSATEAQAEILSWLDHYLGAVE